MINLIQSYVHIEDTLNKFSKNSFNDYYEKYCLANDKNRESTTEKVYYNFHNKDKYRNYCDEFAGLVKSEKICLYHFFDIHTTIKYFKFLLRRTGCIDKNLLLTLSEPAFHNNDGDVIIGLHAFSYVTQNYGKLCIDFIIYGRNLRPISMYPLDVEEFERKFKLICDKYEK